MDQKTSMKNNLIVLLDQTYPGANNFFNSPAKSDDSQKWVDFANTHWHVDCIRTRSLDAFTAHYKNWCKRRDYNFSADRAEEIYRISSYLIAVFPNDGNTKMLIRQATAMLNTAFETVESLRRQMDETASMLPKYPVVMAMDGVDSTFEPQLMAEIGDVTHFTHRGALTAFAGVAPPPGKMTQGSTSRKASVPQRKVRQAYARLSSRSWTAL